LTLYKLPEGTDKKSRMATYAAAWKDISEKEKKKYEAMSADDAKRHFN